MGDLRTADVAREAGVTNRQVDYWRSLGVLGWIDRLPTDPGSGHPVAWTPADARIIRILGRYTNALPTNASVADMANLAALAARHMSGYAVRAANSVWTWAPMLDASPTVCAIVVPLAD